MDKALVTSLDKYIVKLQGVSDQLKSARTGEFRRSKRNNAAIAKKSATHYLSYCSLVRLFRKNIGSLETAYFTKYLCFSGAAGSTRRCPIGCVSFPYRWGQPSKASKPTQVLSVILAVSAEGMECFGTKFVII